MMEQKLEEIYLDLIDEYSSKEINETARKFLNEFSGSIFQACKGIVEQFKNKKDVLEGLKLIFNFYHGLAMLTFKGNNEMKLVLEKELKYQNSRYRDILWG